MQINEIKSLIEKAMPSAIVEVDGDGTHFGAIVVSEEFLGKTMVQQHQLVYKALGSKVGNDIHALTVQTYTPKEWEEKKGLKII